MFLSRVRDGGQDSLFFRFDFSDSPLVGVTKSGMKADPVDVFVGDSRVALSAGEAREMATALLCAADYSEGKI